MSAQRLDEVPERPEISWPRSLSNYDRNPQFLGQERRTIKLAVESRARRNPHTRLIERPSEIAVLADLIHREILYRLLSGPAGNSLRQIARLGSHGQRVSKVVAWLREHFRGPLRIDQLAKMAGMGVSTLHRHFHELTDMSPIQYQKRIRLHEARRLMLEESYEVGTAALDVGYESSTQFIREYRRLFGEAPLRNIKALRTTG